MKSDVKIKKLETKIKHFNLANSPFDLDFIKYIPEIKIVINQAPGIQINLLN